MNLYSTNNVSLNVDLKYAVMKGLPDDNGLFMPAVIPTLPASFWATVSELSFEESSFSICQALIGDYIPEADLKDIVKKAVSFPAPLVEVTNHFFSLELWHGPSLAFKDFGARFMAQLMSYFNREESRKLTILVATSGDTGGAVAAGFYNTPGIEVVVLYPSGKVSPLQEKQLTTLGGNITALEVDGTFDDCQYLVKQAFLDTELNQHLRLSSANSINIARLIPQMFYYVEAYKQIKDKSLPIVCCVPSGNLGNVTAGLIAKRMGLPIDHFIVASNANDVVPEYLTEGVYKPRVSVRTLSNAMDVGSPSNFARILDLYGSTWNNIKNDISGAMVSDEDTKVAMREVFGKYRYLMDPHGAVAYLALRRYVGKLDKPCNAIFLETAHPAKFIEDVESILECSIEIPSALAELQDKQKVAIEMSSEFSTFKAYLMSR